jgi:lysylphosphatidylglycerol synthetase-like protein (DUF2156 family)
MFNPSIAHAFRFSEVDLLQNKNGKVSDRQKATSRRSGKIACIALVILGLIIALGVYHVNKDKNDTAFMRASITFSVFASIGLYFLFRAFYIASQAVVKSVSGNISVVFKRKTGNCLVIGNISFPVSETPTENLFVLGKSYTVYYMGTSALLTIDEN